MILPALYHWSPADRHDAIRARGLVPGSAECVATSRQPHICLSPSPQLAWLLSGDTGQHDTGAWDLWQVRLDADDEVHFRPTFGDTLEEVNVRTVIPADRVWWVARRDVKAGEHG